MYIALEQPTGAHLLTPDDEEVAVPVTLRYTSDDPLAVHLVFPAWISLDDEEVTWTFARSLLEEGLSGPSGLGTVRLRPHGPSHSRTVVELHTPEGTAAVRFDTTALRRFLTRSYEVTERGAEPVEPALDQGCAPVPKGA
ncbi:SsgA family sporulation/cell division regulator [Streptomyces sediminimaris]|uniref:SsgA family sporulation/cell division regulator n=1 Tax=Streptomyces sediminimaris TaxID=3383721 RepID=UPI00399B99F1